jgi:carboxypeptidase C (cathepsin A)
VVTAVEGALADTTSYSGSPTAALAAAVERAATMHGQLTLNGSRVDYTATSGHLTAVDARSGAPTVSFFYVAYTRDNQDLATRPVTFFYNGGPGSASLWLHIGSFGPKRLVTNMPATAIPQPPQLIDNSESLLDTSDLVFVDAVGTGYSQAIAPRSNRDFWSVDADAASLRDFVQRYVAANARQASPKFLYGESYGGPRTAVLANLLESAGVHLNGVVLQSPILDYNANCGVFDDDAVSCEGYVPTYAAVGAYHLRANPVPLDLSGYLQQARDFASGAYRSAMPAWQTGHVVPPSAVQQQLTSFTGLPLLTWQQSFNLKPGAFQQTVAPGQLVGRYDARVAAPLGSALTADGDPSLTVINSAFVSTVRNYLVGTLHYSAPTTYIASNDLITSWNFSHDGKVVPDTVPDLAAAMTLNPALKVLSLSGIYDLATPFYQTERDLARLGNNPNITIKHYQGGHMSYLDDIARRSAWADLQAFYQAAR